jgi:hypothetical protein
VSVKDRVLLRRFWRRWVTGDVDCKLDLLIRLAWVARTYQRRPGGKVRVLVRCGRRTRQEHAVLYGRYLAGRGPLAARTGTSNHETGNAADCGLIVNGRESNIGETLIGRALLRQAGLCLPVGGEKWHVEVGKTWRA